MSVNFEKIGFKCGIEVHQRVDTPKLFCNCYCDPNKELPGGNVVELRRRLRAVVGELGTVDPAAAFEASQGKEFVYQSDSASSCLVECDEEPPHAINLDAVKAALQIAFALKAEPVDELQVMRKTVVDGSAVSGFQRTALLALDGSIETSKGKVGIQTVCIEEESAGIIDKTGGTATYRLDRLGIPLIEIATDSTIKSGEHAAEIAEKIGLLLRSTGKVQRGLGTIRQDLNVSITGGTRVEIKGAQELALISKLVENEVLRQQKLIEIREELQKRRVRLPAEPKLVSVSHLLKDSNCKFVAKAIASGGVAFALKLEGFAGLPGRELMPGHRLGTEFSGYAKASAGVGGIIHSDEDPTKYALQKADFAAIAAELGCAPVDAWIVCVDSEYKAVRALEAVFKRALIATQGVPPETRRAEAEKSVFMRPIPGAARMYPETDVPPLRIDKSLLSSVSALEDFEARRKRFVKLGLNEELAEKILRGTNASLFEEIVRRTGADALVVATTLEETIKALRREGVAVDVLSTEKLVDLFALYAKNEFVKAAIPELLKAAVAAPNNGVARLIEEKKLTRYSSSELAKIVSELAAKGLPAQQLFGEIMRLHRLRVDAAELQRLLSSVSARKQPSQPSKRANLKK